MRGVFLRSLLTGLLALSQNALAQGMCADIAPGLNPIQGTQLRLQQWLKKNASLQAAPLIQFDPSTLLANVRVGPASAFVGQDMRDPALLPFRTRQHLALDALELAPRLPQRQVTLQERQQIEAVWNNRLTIEWARRRFGTDLVRGALGANPATLSAADLAKSDLSVRLFQNLGAGKPTTAEMLKQLRDLLNLVMVVNPGTPDTGGTLPGSGPVVKDPERKCYRPATDNDRSIVTGGSTPIAYIPWGFQEVGLFADQISDDGVNLCTFTLVTPEWAVTALHCVGERSTDVQGWKEKPGFRTRVRVLLQKPEVEANKLQPCLENKPAECPYSMGAIAGIFGPQNVVWDGDVPDRDVALVQVRFPSKAVGKVAELTLSKPAAKQVTIAGYGLSNRTSYLAGRGLLVSWYQPAENDPNAVIWRNSGATGGQCSGDSGGPVFDSDLYGRPSEVHSLIAVTSALIRKNASNPNATGAEACLNAEGRSQSTYRHREFLCRHLKGQIAACAAG